MATRSIPKLTVNSSLSPLYDQMGYGFTDTMFLLGHADGLRLNDPQKVTSMRDTLDLLGEDTGSPLVLGLLQAYFAGAREIYVMAVAPMSEYEDDIELRDLTYYSTHKDALDLAYSAIEDWDIPRIIVPLEAPFNCEVDFATQLITHCVNSFNGTGQVRMGIMGTRGEVDDALLDAMSTDPRLGAYGEQGKFVSVFAGEGAFQFKELPLNSRGSFAASCAAMLSQAPLSRGITNVKIPSAINVVGVDLDSEKANALAEKGVNVVGRTTKGRRGAAFEVVPLTDNTITEDGESLFWNIHLTRLVAEINRSIRKLARRSVGTIREDQFKAAVHQHMINLVNTQILRSYTASIYRDPSDYLKLMVELSVLPYHTVREVTVDILVGPVGV